MTSVEELASVSCQIIANVGDARSLRLEAVQAAKAGDFDRAEELLAQAEQAFLKGHEAHTTLIQQEAAGDPVSMTLLLTHAEDQLMSAEAFGILAEEFIDVYRRLGNR